MSYSNWQGGCPGGELSERADVQRGKCPTPCRSIALAKTNLRTGNSISQAVSPCDIDVVSIENIDNFSASIVSRGNCCPHQTQCGRGISLYQLPSGNSIHTAVSLQYTSARQYQLTNDQRHQHCNAWRNKKYTHKPFINARRKRALRNGDVYICSFVRSSVVCTA